MGLVSVPMRKVKYYLLLIRFHIYNFHSNNLQILLDLFKVFDKKEWSLFDKFLLWLSGWYKGYNRLQVFESEFEEYNVSIIEMNKKWLLFKNRHPLLHVLKYSMIFLIVHFLIISFLHLIITNF